MLALAAYKIMTTDTEHSPPSSHLNVLDKARDLVAKGSASEALSLVIELKRSRIQAQDIDYVRAMCFAELHKLDDAREALLEELRYYPKNLLAKELLDQVKSQQKGAPKNRDYDLSDQDFFELIPKIRDYSMLPEIRLAHLFALAKYVCLEDVPGDFVECGVSGGGASALLLFVINKYSQRPRLLYACDTFEGMPSPSSIDRLNGVKAELTGWGTGTCSATMDSVTDICSILGVTDKLRIVKGNYEQMLPLAKKEIGPLAFLHVDCHWYESVNSVFKHLYPAVFSKGIVQVDDYGSWDGVTKAVQELQAKSEARFDIRNIDGGSAWFSKIS